MFAHENKSMVSPSLDFMPVIFFIVISSEIKHYMTLFRKFSLFVLSFYILPQPYLMLLHKKQSATWQAFLLTLFNPRLMLKTIELIVSEVKSPDISFGVIKSPNRLLIYSLYVIQRVKRVVIHTFMHTFILYFYTYIPS